MDDEGTHPENGFEKCAASGTQKNISHLLLCSIREQKYSSILQPSLKVVSNSLIPKDFFSNLK